MKREEAKQNLVALGIDEPTDAQVTNYLNQFHNNRPQTEPTPVLQPQPQPQPTPEPKPEPNTEPKPTSGSEDDLESLRNQIEQLQRENVQKDIRAYAAEKGLKGEQADKILASFQDNLDAAKVAIDSMTEIISESNKTAIADYEKKNLYGTPNPDGGKGGKVKDEKPDDVKNAESITFGTQASEQSEKDYYVMK